MVDERDMDEEVGQNIKGRKEDFVAKETGGEDHEDI